MVLSSAFNLFGLSSDYRVLYSLSNRNLMKGRAGEEQDMKKHRYECRLKKLWLFSILTMHQERKSSLFVLLLKEKVVCI